MKLTIATVVRNDLAGLQRTIASAQHLLGSDVEYWVIDGSTDGEIRNFLSTSDVRIRWVSEPDHGIYDAMNKALSRATGDYIVFINAGDTLLPHFDPAQFFDAAGSTSRVLLGRIVEVVGHERYLCPGVGHEEMIFEAPRHQATFYPRNYYSQNRYRVDQRIGADGIYTLAGIASVGATFVSMAVAEFYVGGVSSTYGSWKTLKQRYAEAASLKNKFKILLKALMWRVLPQQFFYRVLASYKYTKLLPGQEIANEWRVIHRAAKPRT